MVRLAAFLLVCRGLFAAIAIDGSAPIRFAGTPANNVNITSASFTPPNTSLLLVLISADTNNNVAATMTVSDSTALSWTQIIKADESTDSTSNGGYAAAFYAKVTTGSSMTVSVKRTTASGGTNRISVKAYVVTGHDTTGPIGASGGAVHNVNNSISPTIYTSTANNSRGFGCATDWQALGTPTSTDTGDGATYASQISVISAYKAADTATSGTAVTLNFDASGAAAADWNWIGFEVKPAASGSSFTSSTSETFLLSDSRVGFGAHFGTPKDTLSALQSSAGFAAHLAAPVDLMLLNSSVSGLGAHFGVPSERAGLRDTSLGFGAHLAGSRENALVADVSLGYGAHLGVAADRGIISDSSGGSGMHLAAPREALAGIDLSGGFGAHVAVPRETVGLFDRASGIGAHVSSTIERMTLREAGALTHNTAVLISEFLNLTEVQGRLLALHVAPVEGIGAFDSTARVAAYVASVSDAMFVADLLNLGRAKSVSEALKLSHSTGQTAAHLGSFAEALRLGDGAGRLASHFTGVSEFTVTIDRWTSIGGGHAYSVTFLENLPVRADLLAARTPWNPTILPDHAAVYIGFGRTGLYLQPRTGIYLKPQTVLQVTK